MLFLVLLSLSPKESSVALNDMTADEVLGLVKSKGVTPVLRSDVVLHPIKDALVPVGQYSLLGHRYVLFEQKMLRATAQNLASQLRGQLPAFLDDDSQRNVGKVSQKVDTVVMFDFGL